LRIRALRSKDQQPQNVGGVRRGNGAQRNDLAERNPESPNRRRSVYRLLCAGFAFFILHIYL